MSIEVFPLKAARIGCDNVVWCQLLSDTELGLNYQMNPSDPTSQMIYNLPGVMIMTINPNMSIETAYFDDGPGDVATTLGNIEITFQKSVLGLKEQAVLLGASYVAQQYTDGGGNLADLYELLNGVSDVPPWGALGFRTLRADGSYRYIWLMKGKFSLPTYDNETKADTINFQADEITGRFVPTIYSYPLTNTNVWSSAYANRILYPWKSEWEETALDDPVLIAKIKQAWFTQVITPDFDATLL